jgi:hypothetical protein
MEKGNPGEPCQFVAALVDRRRFAGISAFPQVNDGNEQRRRRISDAILMPFQPAKPRAHEGHACLAGGLGSVVLLGA